MMVSQSFQQEYDNQTKVLGDTDYRHDEPDSAVPVFFFTVNEIMDKYKEFLGIVIE